MIRKNIAIAVHCYSLTIDGLSITYTTEGEKVSLKMDPHSSCDLFQETGLIEDFVTDGFEPMVLAPDIEGRYQYWCEFVNNMSISKPFAEKIVRHYELQKNKQHFFSQVNLDLQMYNSLARF